MLRTIAALAPGRPGGEEGSLIRVALLPMIVSLLVAGPLGLLPVQGLLPEPF